MTIEWIAYLLDNDRADYPGFSVAEDKFAIMFNERFVNTWWFNCLSTVPMEGVSLRRTPAA